MAFVVHHILSQWSSLLVSRESGLCTCLRWVNLAISWVLPVLEAGLQQLQHALVPCLHRYSQILLNHYCEGRSQGEGGEDAELWGLGSVSMHSATFDHQDHIRMTMVPCLSVQSWK